MRAVVLLHDPEGSTEAETGTLRAILEAARFSLALEPIPGPLSELATARLPVATYLEEADFIVNHRGETQCYKKALDPPRGVKPIVDWVQELRKALRTSQV